MSPHFPSALRTRALFCAVVAALTASAATATTLHREAITQTTGSEGASTTLQTSATSSALQGEVAAKSNTSIKLPFGVLGEYDASTSTFGIGVVGLSTSGYGVAAESFGSNPSLIALSGDGNDALDALSSSGGGVALTASTSGSDFSIIAQAANGIAVYATSNAQNAVEGVSDSSNGVAGFSETGSGLVGTATSETTSGSGNGLFSVGVTASAGTGTGALVQNDSEFNPALVINNAYDNGSGLLGALIQAGANGGNLPKFTVDGQGDILTRGSISASGSITSGSNTISAVSRNAKGSMLTYAPQQAEASMEDVGSARLINGVANVPLASDFQQTIDTNVPYAVFLTPYGDNRGLYIASRTPSGFVVRETQGGRSSLSFDYRIVAKPYGSRLARLPNLERTPFMASQARALRRPPSLEKMLAVRAKADAAVARAQEHAKTMSAFRR